MPSSPGVTPTFTIVILGSGGAGAITAGTLLLEAAGRAGWYGLMTRSVGPQIRGGEALATVRLGATPVTSHGDRVDLLVALDWQNALRFIDEVRLDTESIILADEDTGKPPPPMRESGASVLSLPLRRLSKSLPNARPNVLILGALAQLLGIPADEMQTVVNRALTRKGVPADNASAVISAGIEAARNLPIPDFLCRPAKAPERGRWLVTGNEAAALGALRGGVRFAAVYPITPATDLSEWLASPIQRLGGQLVQAEDEIAAINMVLGSSFGGIPSLTATSGPGLALMSETLGLAVAAEIPAVVINVMRGGPSTGIPTKSEQSDLSIALHGLHGDAPHLVLAAHSVQDCLFTTQWAVQLAEALQCPAIVLSDQFLGQARTVCDRPQGIVDGSRRLITARPKERYHRYEITPRGVSAMALPGIAGGQYTAEGLEHNSHGNPSSQAADHQAQLDKRRDKLERLDYGEAWASIDGEGDTVIVTWGSSTGPCVEAANRARAQGMAVRVVSLRLLMPTQPNKLSRVITGAHRVLVVEQSHSGQFHRYLRAYYELPDQLELLHRPGPLTIRPGEVHARLCEQTIPR